jgi:hypothetical protein
LLVGRCDGHATSAAVVSYSGDHKQFPVLSYRKFTRSPFRTHDVGFPPEAVAEVYRSVRSGQTSTNGSRSR